MIFVEIAVVAALVLLGIVFYANEAGWGSFLSFGAIIGATWWLGWISPLTWGIGTLAAVAGLYLVVGGAYVLLVMWPELLWSRQDGLKHIIERWNDPKRADQRAGLTHWNQTTEYRSMFTARENKARLAGMVGLWPWDLLDKLLNKPIEWMLQLSRKVFDWVGGRVVGSMEKELNLPKRNEE